MAPEWWDLTAARQALEIRERCRTERVRSSRQRQSGWDLRARPTRGKGVAACAAPQKPPKTLLERDCLPAFMGRRVGFLRTRPYSTCTESRSLSGRTRTRLSNLLRHVVDGL